jgi:hypothetical protein
LGEIQIPLGMLVDGIERDEWFDLLKARSGKIHLKILANGPSAGNDKEILFPSENIKQQMTHQKYHSHQKNFYHSIISNTLSHNSV